MLASREWIPRLALSLATVAVTLIVGRAWCGWICPLGTLLERLSFPCTTPCQATLNPLAQCQVPDPLRRPAAAVFGSTTLLLALDPLAILTRTMTAGILPGLNYAATDVLTTLYPVAPLQGVLNGLSSCCAGLYCRSNSLYSPAMCSSHSSSRS